MKNVRIFTDGCCKGNPGPGGYACILKYNGRIKEIIGAEKQTTNNVNWKIEDGFHCGGYAKINSELESFLSSWKTDSEIPIEAVYTGKLFWGLRSLIEQGAIEKGSEVIAIHSGGIFRDVI